MSERCQRRSGQRPLSQRNARAEALKVLVIGLPRSGTTWIASTLAQTGNAALVSEPDNHYNIPFALRAKRRLPGGFHPALSPADEAPLFEALWREAFGENGTRYSLFEQLRRTAAQRLFESAGAAEVSRCFLRPDTIANRLKAAELLAVPERPPGRADAIIVKSVYSVLAAEWIAARLDEVQVVVVLRDMLSLLSSWVALDWVPGADEHPGGSESLQEALRLRHGVPPPAGSPLARVTWFLALLALSLEATVRRHPGWHVARYEDLCERPAERFRELAARVGLAPSTALAAGPSGSPFESIASSPPEEWRSRLTGDQIAEITAVISAFPLQIYKFDTSTERQTS
jgi:hypothetical protein